MTIDITEGVGEVSKCLVFDIVLNLNTYVQCHSNTQFSASDGKLGGGTTQTNSGILRPGSIKLFCVIWRDYDNMSLVHRSDLAVAM